MKIEIGENLADTIVCLVGVIGMLLLIYFIIV